MSPPSFQITRFDRLQRRFGDLLLSGLRGSWRRRSLVVLALLLGFYGGQNVTALWLLVLAIELMVRLRSRMVAERTPLGWLLLDNLRIGLVYALVLEAFKLGS